MLPFRMGGDLWTRALKGSPHCLKIQHYWSLNIRIFTVIIRTLVGGVEGLTPPQRYNQCNHQPHPIRPQDRRWGSLTALQRYSRCNLQPQPIVIKERNKIKPEVRAGESNSVVMVSNSNLLTVTHSIFIIGFLRKSKTFLGWRRN